VVEIPAATETEKPRFSFANLGRAA
jgi:hypothetical protein